MANALINRARKSAARWGHKRDTLMAMLRCSFGSMRDKASPAQFNHSPAILHSLPFHPTTRCTTKARGASTFRKPLAKTCLSIGRMKSAGSIAMSGRPRLHDDRDRVHFCVRNLMTKEKRGRLVCYQEVELLMLYSYSKSKPDLRQSFREVRRIGQHFAKRPC